jgi:hypothetical protein
VLTVPLILADRVQLHGPKTRRHDVKPRSVRLLAPLAQDLREWRMACGRPADDDPVIPALDGEVWSEVGYEQWRGSVWPRVLAAVGVPYQRPYDCRHSFASLLLHEGRSVIYGARQLGTPRPCACGTTATSSRSWRTHRRSVPRTRSWPRAVAKVFGQSSERRSDVTGARRVRRSKGPR